MVVLNEGRDNEVALRVVLESDPHGREYFDNYDNPDEILQAVARLVKSSASEASQDGIERVVSVAIVPKTQFNDESGYGFGLFPNNE